MSPTFPPRGTPRPPPRAARLGAVTAAVTAALAAALSCAGAWAAPPPAPPADSADFLARWRQAVARPGGEAIADLTAWPFLFEGRRLQRPAFIAQAVPPLFAPGVRRCLQRAAALPEDGRLVMSCAPYGFVFAPTDAGWRLVEFFVDTP